MPTIVRRRGTRAALEAVYEDLAPDIEAAARRHAAKYNDDPDESLSDAQLVFLEAYHSHDPSKSDFGQRLGYLLPLRLLERARGYAKRNRALERVVADLDALPTTPAPVDGYSVPALAQRVSAEARTVLELLFAGPPELDAVIRADPNPTSARIRGHVQAHLRDTLGWTEQAIRAAFAEIQAAI